MTMLATGAVDTDSPKKVSDVKHLPLSLMTRTMKFVCSCAYTQSWGRGEGELFQSFLRFNYAIIKTLETAKINSSKT